MQVPNYSKTNLTEIFLTMFSEMSDISFQALFDLRLKGYQVLEASDE